MKLIRLRCLAVFLMILAAVAIVAEWRKGCAAAENQPATSGWTDAKAYQLGGLKVSLSKPVLVGRSKEFFWFPQIDRLPNGELVAIVYTAEDWYPSKYTGVVMWSADGGLTWSAPKSYTGSSNSHIVLPSGDLLLLPAVLFPRPNGAMGAPYHVIPNGKREIQRVESGVTFTGFPYHILPPDPRVTTCQTFGQTVKLRNGKYLEPVYGLFKDFPQQKLIGSGKEELYEATTPEGGTKEKRYGFYLAESRDGIRWERSATIADENCPLKGAEGPSESAISLLKDGRLMCLFRVDSGYWGKKVLYGQSWSSDEGKTWTTPVSASGPFSVAPSTAVMKDGTVILAGGRPGLYLWFNADGSGKDWQEIDTRLHHNAFHPEELIADQGKNTTSYAQVIAVDDTHLLYIYDRNPYERIAHGWDTVPKDPTGTFSVWVVRVTLERAAP